jgi:hypothetical protein
MRAFDRLAASVWILVALGAWPEAVQANCCTGSDKYKPRFRPFCVEAGGSTSRPHFCYSTNCPTGTCQTPTYPICLGGTASSPACLEELTATTNDCVPDVCPAGTTTTTTAGTTTTTSTLAPPRALDTYGLLAMRHMNITDTKVGGVLAAGCHLGVNCTLQGSEGPVGVFTLNKVWVPEGTHVVGWKTRFRVRGCPQGHVDKLFSNEIPGSDRCNVCIGNPPALTSLPTNCDCRTQGKAPRTRPGSTEPPHNRLPFLGASVIRDTDLTAQPNTADGNSGGETCDNCATVDPVYFENYWDVNVVGLSAPYRPAPPIAEDSNCMTNGVSGINALSATCGKQMLDRVFSEMSTDPSKECNQGDEGTNDPGSGAEDPERSSCHHVVVAGPMASHNENLKRGVYRRVNVQGGTLRLVDPGRYVIGELATDKNVTIELDDAVTQPVTLFVRLLKVNTGAKVFWKDPLYTFGGSDAPTEPCELVRVVAFESATVSDALGFSKSSKAQGLLYAPRRIVNSAATRPSAAASSPTRSGQIWLRSAAASRSSRPADAWRISNASRDGGAWAADCRRTRQRRSSGNARSSATSATRRLAWTTIPAATATRAMD